MRTYNKAIYQLFDINETLVCDGSAEKVAIYLGLAKQYVYAAERQRVVIKGHKIKKKPLTD